jgi:hypothetical protein
MKDVGVRCSRLPKQAIFLFKIIAILSVYVSMFFGSFIIEPIGEVSRSREFARSTDYRSPLDLSDPLRIVGPFTCAVVGKLWTYDRYVE